MFRRFHVEHQWTYAHSKPPVADRAQEAFLNLAGQDGEIDAYELQKILNSVFMDDFTFDGFSADMTRSMVAMRDYDMSGKLCYDDFKKLWSELTLCKKTFGKFDNDGTGKFNFQEFQSALNSMGMEVPDSVLRSIHTRYCGKEGEVYFDDFVSCYIRLRTMMKSFQYKDPEGNGDAVFSLDEFVQLVMYS